MNRPALHAFLASAFFIALSGCTALPQRECPMPPSSCSEGDPLPRATLPGAWVSARMERPMTLYIHGAGDFTLQARKAPGWRGGYARGHWTLEGNTFNGSIDSSGLSALPAGHQWSDTIVHLSATDLILSTPSGKIERFWREGTQ